MQLPDYGHFAEHHWLKAPLHLPGNQVGQPLSPVQSLRILVAAGDQFRRNGSATLRCYTSREVNPLPYLARSDDASIAAYVQRIARDVGAENFTLILNRCESYDFDLFDRMRHFLASLFDTTGVCLETDAAFYLSRADTTVFGIHEETYENFIFQIDGHKRFHLWPPDFAMPAEKFRATEYTELLASAMNVTLAPGDLLYIPGGHYHVADTAPQELSLHLSLNLNTDHEGILRLVRKQATRMAKARLSKTARNGGSFAMPRSKRPNDITLPADIEKAARAFESLDLSWPVTAGWMRVLSGAGFTDAATDGAFALTEADRVVATRPNAILSASAEDDAACAVNGTLIHFPKSDALLGLIRRLNRGKQHQVSKLLDEFAGDRDDMTVDRGALLDLLVRIGQLHGLKKA